jgi:hypothetical protein
MGFGMVERRIRVQYDSGMALMEPQSFAATGCEAYYDDKGRLKEAVVMTRGQGGKEVVHHWREGDGSFVFWRNDRDVPTVFGR